jgi:hypothetical protein
MSVPVTRTPYRTTAPLGRRTYDFARLNVECGAVPRTGHFVPRHLSIGEKAAAVIAGVVEREELAVAFL